MSLRSIVLSMLIATAGSVAAMVFAARVMMREPVLAAALAFAMVATLVAILANRPLWALPQQRISAQAAPAAGRRNAIMMALVLVWGSVAMLAVYGLSPLKWQHWWQYGLGMALYAAGLALYADMLAKPGHPAASGPMQFRMLQLTIAQGMLCIGGLAWLVLSGKLATPKMDWAANAIFIAGGLALAALSAIAVITQQRLTRRG